MSRPIDRSGRFNRIPQSRHPTQEIDFAPVRGETLMGLQGDLRALYETEDLPFFEPEATLATPEAFDVIKRNLARLPGLDPARQFEIYRQIASLYQNQPDRTLDAIEFYERALQVRPGDFSSLHALLELLTGSGHHQLLVNVLVRMLGQEQDPRRRCHFHYTVGIVLRDQLEAPDLAVTHFEKALDDDPGMLEAFHAIERHFKHAQAWKQLEAAYRRMLDRLPDDCDTAIFVTLLDKLARVNLEHLRDRDAAREALTLGVQLDPHNARRRALLGRV